jgi:glycosyltransferase involved in cell wall biosynthesis
MQATRLARLLVALPSTRMGGTERHTAVTAARLAARAFDVTVLADASLHDALRPLLGPSVELRTAPIGWDEDAAPRENAARQAAELERALAARRPDALLLPLAWPDAGLGLMQAAATAGLPRLVLFHLAAEGPAPPAIGALPERPALERAALAAVSRPVAARVARFFHLPEARVAVLPNPAPRPATMARDVARATLRAAIGLPADAPLILFAGRLEEAKGADLLPDVSARLKGTMACLGDGPLRGLLQARAAADPRGLLRVLGPVADPSPWYLAADALLLPSRLEGAPLVFLEAASHRLPVIATAAALEALGQDAARMARIAEPTPPALAAAVDRVLKDAAATAMMVEAAAAHAAGLDWEGMMDGLVGLLRGAAVLTPREAA